MYRMKIFFSDGTVEDCDEDYATEVEAEADFRLWLESWDTGGETLELAGRPYSDAEIIDHEIYEADE